ncbi:hypothetical protein [Endozoicomonas arenosclerae]|uniref:hypothetical protein n=1 Tax=Endozoicomonas arenosclerae TaxID=1633495 RepID=UPI0007829C27|nr:hypothetical protein [Endozoicomonas arenosclerae]
MDSKIAGTLSLLGAAALLGIWWIFLFSARPECFNSYELAYEAVKYVLSPAEPNRWLFLSTLLSILISFTTGLLLIAGKQKNRAMLLVLTHTIAAIFIYTWSLVVAIALPLLFFNKVYQRT